LIFSSLIASVASQARAEEEILAGRNAARQLRIEVGYAQPLALPVSIFPGISGYATGELGFHSTILDDPTNDFFQLSPSADFRFILLAKDAGMEVWNDTGSAYMGIGEAYYIGPAPFDNHPIWNLVTGTPGNSYSLTLKLHVVNGVYTDSAQFVLSFTAEAPPGPFRLDITQTDPQHAVLTWPTNAQDWALESADVVTATSWTPATNAPNVTGTNFTLSISTAGGQQFFRLHKP